MKPRISMIVAMSENRVIGRDGGIPWKIPGEQKRFREITTPHPMIMGRKTYESIGRVLPDRATIIVTRDETYHVDGAIVVHSLAEGIEKAKALDNEEIFIVGGGKLFTDALPETDRLYLTIIHKDMDGDTFFPEYPEFTKEISREEHTFEDLHYSYITLER